MLILFHWPWIQHFAEQINWLVSIRWEHWSLKDKTLPPTQTTWYCKFALHWDARFEARWIFPEISNKRLSNVHRYHFKSTAKMTPPLHSVNTDLGSGVSLNTCIMLNWHGGSSVKYLQDKLLSSWISSAKATK